MQQGMFDYKEWNRWLHQGAKELAIDIDNDKVASLYQFATELLDANETFNLTRVTDPLQIAENLILDSMVPGQFIPKGAHVLDLGTGAGFPGIPLKIAFPDLCLTLVDSKRKKINFLKYIIRHLQLKNIQAIQARAQNLKSETGKFDVVVSRAVSSVGELSQMAYPLLKHDGTLIAMKSSRYQSELDSAQLLKSDAYTITDLQIKPYRLPHLKIDRALITIRFGEDSATRIK